MPYLKLKDIKSKEIVKGYSARFVHSGNMTTAYWEVEAGAELPMHSHPHEQISNVISGSFKFNLDGDIRTIGEGDVVVIPPDIPHSGKAVTFCRIIDTFYPERENYK